MRYLSVIFIIFFAFEGLAADESADQIVEKRQSSMKAMVKHVKLLGSMIKGKVGFDKHEAEVAMRGLASEAASVILLFESESSNFLSEAKSEIWIDFDDFSDKASELESLALKLSGKTNSIDDLKDGIFLLGQACKDCHSKYRE